MPKFYLTDNEFLARFNKYMKHSLANKRVKPGDILQQFNISDYAQTEVDQGLWLTPPRHVAMPRGYD
jgi:hypothetical protein